jgi:hypothetical protein
LAILRELRPDNVFPDDIPNLKGSKQGLNGVGRGVAWEDGKER